MYANSTSGPFERRAEPKGSGRGRSPQARINRVVVMLDNDELKILNRIARKEQLPLGTAAYRIMARVLLRHR